MHNNIFLEIKNTKEKNKITIPKKIIKKATDRNKVKRRIKHILRSVDYSKKNKYKNKEKHPKNTVCWIKRYNRRQFKKINK